MKPRIKAPVVSLRILPSAMTVAAICLGLSAVKFALDNRPTEAMAFLAVAAILDALDGRIARILKATSRMGEEIDSLADAVNFGVAPAFIVYGTLLSHSRVGWIVVLLYAVCIVLRLARFNALLDVDKPAYEKEYFVGMPAPAGAIGAIGPLAAKMQFGEGWWTSELAVVIWMIGVSLLVVSTLPMRKIHTFSVSPNMVAPLLAAAGDPRRGVDPLRVHRHPGDHRRLRHPHPVRDPHQALPGGASGGLGRQTTTTARGATGDSTGAAAPPVHDAARTAQAGRADVTQTRGRRTDPPLSHTHG